MISLFLPFSLSLCARVRVCMHEACVRVCVFPCEHVRVFLSACLSLLPRGVSAGPEELCLIV